MSKHRRTSNKRPATRRRIARLGAIAAFASMLALVFLERCVAGDHPVLPAGDRRRNECPLQPQLLLGRPARHGLRGAARTAADPDPEPLPDKGSTYFVSQIEMPENSTLTIHGTYPRERYFSFTVANLLAGGAVGNGDFIRDEQIEPDPGSVNPFQVSATKNDRTTAGQTYTVHVVRGPIPANPAPNTLYTTSTSATEEVRLSMRNYIPDQGLDGTGGVDCRPSR